MVKDVSTNLSHSFSVSEKKNIIISGVVKIDSFDSEEFLLETVQGYMNIKGENLENDTFHISNYAFIFAFPIFNHVFLLHSIFNCQSFQY